MRPDIVICDEPTSALDVSIQAQILNLLIDLQKELKITYVFITHDLSIVNHMAKRVAVMYLGRIVEENRTEVLFQNPKHPYTRALIESILTAETEKGLPDTNLGSTYPDPMDVPVGCPFHPRCPKRMLECSEQIPRPVYDGEARVECLLFRNP